MSNGSAASTILRIQTISISVVGAVAVLCFLVSLVTSGDLSATLGTVAAVAAGVCAVIGVSFAVTGGLR
ncbi:hypothetical protein [Parenemella sanctibonifatiensis]|uniref:hypothetical protein n=1 Tax=Parenemella sanctibonifatiensis TaxID=2016505 RepID=UPI00118549BB|nr:hypothetical protein [Parenemella sanctibonifatiensis]